MQIQIDPNIPANLPPEEIRDFQSFIQTALDGLTASAGGEVMTLGTGMFAGLALIVIVIAGVKIAFSGNIQPWEVVRLVIGIWIPWVMMQFYTATIPGMSQTFPGMIAEGGNFLHEMLLGDIISSMQTELGDMVRAIAANMQTQAAQGNVIGILTGGVHAFITAVAGSIILALLILMLIVLFAVTYAQVIWAQIALAILIILGPIFIPFLVFEPLAFLFWGWFKGMLTYSLYAVIAGCVLRVFSAVGIAYITTLGGANLDTQSMTQVGLWTLAVIPLFIAGLLSSLKCGGAGRDARYRRRSGRERTHGYGDNGRDGSGQRWSGSGQNSGIRRDQVSQDKPPPAKDAGAEYAEIWGEAIHTNRHLRTITVGLGIAVILLIIVVIRIASVDPPRPILVRVDEIGRAEAVAYDVMEAQADPLDPTTKYFLNRFVYDFYSRRRATVEENWSRSLRFLTTDLANASFRAESQNIALLAAGAARDELQVDRVVLRIQANPQEPHSATADFDLVRLVAEGEVDRERWSLSLQFLFLDEIPPDLIVHNPMGIVITYLQGDRAVVTGDR